MRQINAGDILDIAMAGTSATLLAKRWESVLLVNVDNETLSRLIANKEAMDALMKIEGFRSLNSDIETIIAKSEKVKKAKKEGTKDLTPKQKKELSDEEKEYKSKRKQIQEKLIKFATRIPVFMYLTDYRERCLKDVITQLEPGLFKKVTGLSVKDFELLVSLGVFNDSLMNDAVYKFKRYEDASLSYTGIIVTMARIVAAGIRCSRMPTTTRCLPCSRHLWKPLRPLRMTCPQSPISPRTRTSRNRLLQRSLRHSPQSPSSAMAVLRPKPTRRKTRRLPAAKSTNRATAIHLARFPVPPATLHPAR